MTELNQDGTVEAVGIANYQEQPVVLDVNHVSKSFKLPTEQATGLKQAFINWTKGIKGYELQQVLKDVTFQVHQGEFFGIVGRNGGGKSTLLKLIAQIYYPNQGSVTVHGKLVPLMYDDIVEFAELGDFMDQKLKNYSSGMQVRLAFSVAIKAQGDILVLDEVLAVGDEAFQRKCDDYFTEIRKDPTKTVILVTHDMSAIKRYCTRAMFIQDGEVAVIGDRETVAERYTLANLEAQKQEESEKRKALERNPDEYPNGLNARCPLLRTYGVSPLMLTSAETFRFAVEYQYDEPGDFYLAIALHDIRRGGITFDTGARKIKMTKHGHQTVYFELPLNLFNNGEFRLITSLRTPTPGDAKMTDAVAVALDDNACTFVIRDPRNTNYALINNRSLSITQVSEQEAQAAAKAQRAELDARTADGSPRAEHIDDDA